MENIFMTDTRDKSVTAVNSLAAIRMNRRKLALAGAVLGATGMFAHNKPAFAQGATAPPQAATPAKGVAMTVTITAKDFSFDIPKQITAGYTTVTMNNVGGEPHHAQVVKLNEGVDPTKAIADLNASGPPAVLKAGTFVGGPGTVSAGVSASVILNLEAGTYLLICFLRSPDGTPHYAKGMVTSFTVDKGDGSASTEPKADAEIVMDDYSFDTPPQVAAGKMTWKVVNKGGQTSRDDHPQSRGRRDRDRGDDSARRSHGYPGRNRGSAST